MWFKNLNLYKLENFEDVNIEELEETLSNGVFEECQPHEEKKAGWIPPMGENFEQFIHTANGSHMICLKTQIKKIPSSVINEKIREKEEQRRSQDPDFKRFSKEEKEDLKEQIKFELLPHAFPQSAVMFAYIDTKNNYLVVDTSSSNKAEGMITHLKSMIANDGVNIIPLQTVHEPANTMSNWLIDGKAHSELFFGVKCKLKDMSTNGSISYSKHDMDDNQLVEYLTGDKTVSELAFTWGEEGEEKMDFTLTDDFVFKGVKFHSLYRDEVGGMDLEGFAAIFDAEFDIMVRAIREFIPFVTSCFGGVSEY